MAGSAPKSPPAATPRSEVAPRVTIVAARYHEHVTRRLIDGSLAAYRDRFKTSTDVRVIRVPGAFEVPCVVSRVAELGLASGIVALACIVKGDTEHDRVLGDAVTRALMTTSCRRCPVGLGVLTVNTLEQAIERSGGREGNKGADAMNAVLELIAIHNGLATQHEREEREFFDSALHKLDRRAALAAKRTTSSRKSKR